ncbi:ABC transporter permease subunit [Halomicrobium mukohataei]|uniref:ABC transporter permease subunit n=1 Tax=Halomicrobium mukohataei TaxID=57705 RepID=A0A847UD36_9EURY|nr:ABC transporter permease [Halomicrobium mukohataei]NLV10137.1 ABC transporter permease subunit [Halomicrobium mukohataei]
MSRSDSESAADYLADIADESTGPLSRRERFDRFVEDSIRTPFRIIWGDLRTRIGISILLAFTLVGTVGVWIVPKPEFNEAPRYVPPFTNWAVPLGTDGYGKAIGKQLVHATPAVLEIVVAGAVISMVLATVIGVTAGYKGGRVDDILMFITDAVLTIPGLPLILVIASIFTPERPFVVGLLLGIDNWPGLARTLRSQVLSIRHESYVEASRAMGMSSPHILRKDVTKQLMPYITINAANAARGVIFESVGLYFLGILPFTSANWGVIMNEAYQTSGVLSNLGRIHWMIWPMVTISLFSVGLILLSQGMDRLFNPRIRARHSDTAGEETATAKME